MDGTIGSQETRSLYEADEHAWMLEQLALLQQGRVADLDVEHLGEYLRDMTIRDRRALRSRLAQLWLHILKFQAQPEMASRSWRLSVIKQQLALRDMLRDTPSIARYVPELEAEAYEKAMRLAAEETGLPDDAFPPSPTLAFQDALAWKPPAPADGGKDRR